MSRQTKSSLQYNSAATAAWTPALQESLPRKQDVAKRYNISVRTVERLIHDRLIPCIKFNARCVRFRWPDVEAAVNRLVIKEVQ
jgi:excisionase family DNA binding protein